MKFSTDIFSFSFNNITVQLCVDVILFLYSNKFDMKFSAERKEDIFSAENV